MELYKTNPNTSCKKSMKPFPPKNIFKFRQFIFMFTILYSGEFL